MADTGSPPGKRLIRAAEAALMMGIGETKFRELVSRGKFPPAVRLDDEADKELALWLVADVDAYVHLASRRRRRKSNKPKKS